MPHEVELELVELDPQLESTPLLQLDLLLELVPPLELVPFGHLVIKLSLLFVLFHFTRLHAPKQQPLLPSQLLTYF